MDTKIKQPAQYGTLRRRNRGGKLKDQFDNKYCTHMLNACCVGNLEKVKKLFSKGKENPDILANSMEILDMNRPIHFASEYGYIEILELLIKNGAEINVKNKHGESALHLACLNQHVEIVKYLIEFDVDRCIIDSQLRSPFYYTIHHRNAELLVALLGNINVETDFEIFKKSEALHEAVIIEWVEGVDILIKKGFPLNIKNHIQNAPLHLSAENGNYEITKTLLETGADPNVQNASGNKPYQIAFEHGFQNICELLQQFNSKKKLLRRRSIVLSTPVLEVNNTLLTPSLFTPPMMQNEITVVSISTSNSAQVSQTNPKVKPTPNIVTSTESYDQLNEDLNKVIQHLLHLRSKKQELDRQMTLFQNKKMELENKLNSLKEKEKIAK